jgi:hypothetical protein
VSQSGIYLLTGGYRYYSLTGANLVESYFAVNGNYYHVSAIFPYGFITNSATTALVNLGSAIIQLNAGDYVEMIALFESGGSGSVTIENSQYFGISLLGG